MLRHSTVLGQETLSCSFATCGFLPKFNSWYGLRRLLRAPAIIHGSWKEEAVAIQETFWKFYTTLLSHWPEFCLGTH